MTATTTTGGPTTFQVGDEFVEAARDAGRVIPPSGHAEAIERIAGRVIRDVQLQHLQPDRWGAGRPDPSPHRPGDVPVLRGITVNSLMSPVMRGDGRTSDADGLSIGMADRLAAAEPYFVPAGDGSAAAVLESDPPGPDDLADLRLGHDHVTVWFGDDLTVPDDLAVWPEPPSVGDTARWEATRGAGGRSLPHLLGERGCAITGVTITAGPDGLGISDWVDWIIAIPPEPGDPPPWDVDTIRGVLPGRASTATLGGLVATCAAAVAWGDWHPPAADDGAPLPPPEEQDGRDWRKRVRKSAFRKAVERGGFAGVRVIDLAAMHRGADRPSGARAGSPTGRTVTPHVRRGHWRRSRIGPRDGPVDYKRNWIAPTAVAGTAAATTRIRVLPAPR